MYIVEIESGVWLAPWDGDPGRTLVRDSAKRFRLASFAFKALNKAREYRNFENAKVIPVPSHNRPSAKREYTHRTLAGTLGEMPVLNTLIIGGAKCK